MDLGLVISRYGDVIEIGDGVFVPGDGAAHHEVVFRLVVFRPFVEEVCVGCISESSEEGLRVSLGDWFHDIFIPAYWMLSPSRYVEDTGLWVWTQEGEEDGDSGFEMELGAEIRFKVKSINFTQVTNTIKGVQCSTTSTDLKLPKAGAKSAFGGKGTKVPTSTDTVIAKSEDGKPVRKRSSSVDLTDSSKIPASMHIAASICEDGLGLVSWWSYQEEEEEEEEGEEEGEEEEGNYVDDAAIKVEKM